MNSSKGAVQSRVTWRHRWAAYRLDHKRVAAESWRRLFVTPFATVMAWLVIAIALSLPTGMSIAIDNLQSLGDHWDGGVSASLFLDARVAEKRARELADTLRDRKDVSEVVFISREQALREFEQVSGLDNVLSYLDENPLPSVLVVTPTDLNMSSAASERFIETMASIPGVEKVQLDMQWVNRLQQILALFDRLAAVLALLLALGVILVIGNTVRMTIEQRRDEIVVAKLVGASDSFVQRPFLYAGAWYGLGGGILACVIVWVASWWLSGPIEALADAYQASFYAHSLGALPALAVCAIGVVMGLLGSSVAVFKHLREIEPS